MTTVAQKDTHIGADKRRSHHLSCGTIEYDDTVTKVFKHGSLEWGQAGMVGLTELLGLHLKGYDIKQAVIDFCAQCRSEGVVEDHVLGQVLVYTGEKCLLLQTGLEEVDNSNFLVGGDITVSHFSIGSGAPFAYPVLSEGGTIVESITEAMNNDNGTGGGIDMAHEQTDTNAVVNLAPRTATDMLKKSGYLTDDGHYTEKSKAYTSTKRLNLVELEKVGLISNISIS